MGKILTAQTKEDIYFTLVYRGLFPEEQKECCWGSRGTGDLSFIDYHILKEAKTKK